MNEKHFFTPKQAKEIKELLDLRQNIVDKSELKRISSRLRNRGFFISVFGNNFTSIDFDNEVRKGNFIIQEYINLPQVDSPHYPNQIDNVFLPQKKNTNNKQTLIIVAILFILCLIGVFCGQENDTDTPKVVKGKSYDSSYDEQIRSLQEDIKKCDDWVEGIVIYDENCDTIAIVNR